ncbi:MAG: hypothetical protein J6K92_04695, partial [Oscillospiraceae bacterium]|nr:hypothetical protein [Oscillospiraceae bacterium]
EGKFTFTALKCTVCFAGFARGADKRKRLVLTAEEYTKMAISAQTSLRNSRIKLKKTNSVLQLFGRRNEIQ